MYLPDWTRVIGLKVARPAVLDHTHNSAAAVTPRSVPTLVIDDGSVDYHKWLRPHDAKNEFTNLTISQVKEAGPFAIPGDNIKLGWKVIIYCLLCMLVIGLVGMMIVDWAEKFMDTPRYKRWKAKRYRKKTENMLKGSNQGDASGKVPEHAAQPKPAADPVIKQVDGFPEPAPVVIMKQNKTTGLPQRR